MEQKTVSFEFDIEQKADEHVGIFSGYANVTEFRDSGGDIIHHGAFARTLKANKGKVPLLAFHDGTDVIGVVNLEEDERGLKVTKGELNLSLDAGQDIYTNMLFFKERKMPWEMSIGFHLVKNKFEWQDDVRHIHEVNLKEVSLVPPGFAMNSRSRVTSVKATDELLKRIEELEKRPDDLTNVKDELRLLAEKLEALAEKRLAEKQSADSPDQHSADDLQKVPDDDSAQDHSSEDRAATIEAIRARLERLFGGQND